MSAPHAINHYRENAVKPADMYTGSLALLLQKLTGCHCIYSNSFSKEDPNYILGGEYKAALGTIVKEHQIKFVIDLHGASKDREFDMDLGTLHGTSIQANNINEVVRIFSIMVLPMFIKTIHFLHLIPERSLHIQPKNC